MTTDEKIARVTNVGRKEFLKGVVGAAVVLRVVVSLSVFGAGEAPARHDTPCRL